MKLHPAIIEAVHVYATGKQAEDCARRVIRALAEHMLEEAVEKAVQAWLESASDYTRLNIAMRAAIAAFLETVGEME